MGNKRVKLSFPDGKWFRKRIDIKKISAQADSRLVFQLLDIDCKNETAGSIIRLYGVDSEGSSITLFVHRFLAYFYVEVPAKMLGAKGEFAESIQRNLRQSIKTPFKNRIEFVERTSIMGYSQGGKSTFMKISFNLFHLLGVARNILEKQGFQTFESNVSPELRFMIDNEIAGNSWLEIKQFRVRALSETQTLTSIEADIYDPKNINAHHEQIPKWMKIAPFRILSFDIECAGRKGHFPEASKDQVIQIANMVTRQGESKPFINNVFVLGSCSSIAGIDVLSFSEEREMLRSWAEFVRSVDPDILTGYNIRNFDIPYLIDRASELVIEEFTALGRIADSPVRIRNAFYSNRAYGRHETKTISMEGRVIFDLLPFIQKEYRLRSYTLNSVSAHFLGEQKEDVHFSIITDLHRGSADTRRRLAVYCSKDAALPQRLMDRLMLVVNAVEMSRVTGVPLAYLLTRGQQVKVVSQLYRKARTKGVVIPHVPVVSSDSKYTGATVLEPLTGFYKKPVATLDFASLYPSIMIAHNLCYTTLIMKRDILDKMDKEDYFKTPHGDYFVKPRVRRGLLPEVLTDLLDARKKAKKDLENEKDPFNRSVLNGRQLALKISANSVYGFTGASVGALPCLAISSSITSYGREMIEQTKEKVEREYRKCNGYKHDAVVIYGDTDSVMINFGEESVEKAMLMGKNAAELVTSMFKKPIRLAFEKVYYPYLLMAKKRYAGMLWTCPETPSHMDAKGIETVRRDNCALTRDLVQNCLNRLLIDRDVEGAIAFTKRVIRKLLTNRVDLSKLVISKMLGKSADSPDYKVKLPHVELAKRMALRDSGSAPMVGDRVSYVIIQGPKGARQYEKAEDPIYVLEKNLPIDTNHYLEHQLKMPLERIFTPIIGDINKILFGEHTRTIKVSNASSTGMMKYFAKSKKCKNCKSALSEDEKAVCAYCMPEIAEVYLRELRNLRSREKRFSLLWVQCQRCQDTVTQEIICSNRDCPIFYRRTKAAKDYEESRLAIKDFDF